MTSVHVTNPDHGDARGLATRDRSVRLSLKPSSSAGGAVDGVWWPRSVDPAVELVALIEELGIQRSPVGRVDITPAIAELALAMATNSQDPDITATDSHHCALVSLPVKAQASPANEGGPRTTVPATEPRTTHPARSSAADASFCCHTDAAEQITLPISPIGRTPT
jgi:hypothetical protein